MSDRLLDFDLAPLSEYPPDLFDMTNKTDVAVVALAHAYNEQKLLWWVFEQTSKGKPQNDEVSAYAGQWHGMRNTLVRLIHSSAHELLVAVRRAGNEGAFKDAVFIASVSKMRKDHQKRWHELVNAAHKMPKDKEGFGGFLHAMRNGLAFHYSSFEELAGGYTRHFFTDPPRPQNERAYCSFGANMEQTRFYFADAAALGAMKNAGDGDFGDEAQALVWSINEALRFVVEAYVDKRASMRTKT